MKHIALIGLLVVAVGCSSSGPMATNTSVDISKKNYRVVQSNVVGSSAGFRLLGIIPLASASKVTAMSSLNERLEAPEGRARALINVVEERSTIYLILFSIPRVKVRADVIEFTGE